MSYVFVEPWMSSVFGYQGMEYPITDGVAHLITLDEANTIVNVLTILESSVGDSPLIMLAPKLVRSSVADVKILFTRFWVDENILYSLTESDVKASPDFLRFEALQNPRFHIDTTASSIRDIFRRISGIQQQAEEPIIEEDIIQGIIGQAEFDGTVLEEIPAFQNNHIDNGDGAVLVTEIEDTVVPPIMVALNTPVIADADIVSNNISEAKNYQIVDEEWLLVENVAIGIYDEMRYQSSVTRKNSIIHNDKLLYIICDSSPELNNLSCLEEIAMASGKHIVFTRNYENYISRYVKKAKVEHLMKYFLIVVTKPLSSFKRIPKTMPTICLGGQINNIWMINNAEDINIEIERIRRSCSFTEEQKIEKIDEIVSRQSNSPYYKYDYVFKDTYTNVVWGVKDRGIIYLLFDSSGETPRIHCNYMREIKRRLFEKISYKDLLDIDREYFNASHSDNLDTYIYLAISSSKEFFRSLQNEQHERRKTFNALMDKAMEESKLLQRVEVQLSSCDINKVESEAKELALRNYKETLAIDKVSCIVINDETVSVFTKDIYVMDPRTNKWHDIGTFHIHIGFMDKAYNTDNTVRVFNTKYSGFGMGSNFQAPHIFSGGNICHGNLMASMVTAYKDKNLYNMVSLLLIFLQSVNVEDAAGKLINTWPEVSEEIALGTKKKEVITDEKEKEFDDIFGQSIPV